MQVVIPAAGLGVRFLPLSRYVPKELMLLGNRPLIHHAVDEAIRAGFDRAVIVISPGKQAVRGYLEDVKPDLPLSFAEQRHPAGLGDAVLCGASPAPFAVLLPDDVLPGSAHWKALISAHEVSGAAALSLRRVPIGLANRFGMAAYHNEGNHLRVEALVEKPDPTQSPSDHSILGRYVVDDAVLAALRRARPRTGVELQLTDGFAAVTGQAPGVVAVRYDGEIFDCGTPEDYQRSFARYTKALNQPVGGAGDAFADRAREETPAKAT